jgi:soluble cytochrome b562
MRSLVIWTLLCTFAAGTAVARDETVEELKSRVQNALPQDRPKLCMQIVELQLHNADRLYQDGDFELARAAVADIVTYSEQARDSAVETKKHLKNVEIAVRKVAERLRDIKRTLPYEEQPAAEHAVQRLEEVRTSLLKQMFSKEKK